MNEQEEIEKLKLRIEELKRHIIEVHRGWYACLHNLLDALELRS